MFDYLTELMLKSYFTAEVTVGKFLQEEDRERLFLVCADIFLLPKEEANRLYACIRSEELKEISSEREYHQHLRLRQYLSLNDREQKSQPLFEELIDLKGSAFTDAWKGKLLCESGDVRSAACRNLTDAAKDGNIAGMIVLGILQTEGILFCKDERSGIENLRKAADWNSEEGIMAALYYEKGDREKYLSRIRGCLRRAGHSEASEKISRKYGAFEDCHREYLLLEKAFALGIVKRDKYNKSCARLVYSDILNEKDKEALLLNPDQATFYEACALPLKLGTGREEIHPETFLPRTEHPEESEKLVSALKNMDLRGLSSYRPLLLVSDSRYLPSLCAKTIVGSFENAHAEAIEVGELDACDFEPTKNNIFIRSCDEDALNVYLLFFRGEIDGRIFDAVKNFLRSDARRKFRLNRPGVTVDLSKILPICFSDRKNAERLKPCCDTLVISPLSEEEKRNIVGRILSEKQSLYGVKELAVGESCYELLLSLAVDEIDQVLNDAVCANRFKEPTLTRELLEKCLVRVKSGQKHFGFGGGVHEKYE